nr:uncharacterized protein LOC129282306 [Lytechinus pictus]
MGRRGPGRPGNNRLFRGKQYQAKLNKANKLKMRAMKNGSTSSFATKKLAASRKGQRGPRKQQGKQEIQGSSDGTGTATITTTNTTNTNTTTTSSTTNHHPHTHHTREGDLPSLSSRDRTPSETDLLSLERGIVSPALTGIPPADIYDRLKPKGLIDGLSRFFTPTNRRKSRSSSQSSAFYAMRPFRPKVKHKSESDRDAVFSAAVKSRSDLLNKEKEKKDNEGDKVGDAPVIEVKVEKDDKVVRTAKDDVKHTKDAKESPPSLSPSLKKLATQASEDTRSHSNSSSPHSQMMRTGNMQLKGLFDGLSHLYVAPASPRKRGLPPVYAAPKRVRKMHLDMFGNDDDMFKVPAAEESPALSKASESPSVSPSVSPSPPLSTDTTPVKGQLTPKNRKLKKMKGGLTASASKIVKKARAMGSKKEKKGVALSKRWAAMKNKKPGKLKKELLQDPVSTEVNTEASPEVPAMPKLGKGVKTKKVVKSGGKNSSSLVIACLQCFLFRSTFLPSLHPSLHPSPFISPCMFLHHSQETPTYATTLQTFHHPHSRSFHYK